jgi:hypothetical protein
MQPVRSLLDVQALEPPGAALGRQQRAAMRAFEVAIRKLVASLGVLRFFVVDSRCQRPNWCSSPALCSFTAIDDFWIRALRGASFRLGMS